MADRRLIRKVGERKYKFFRWICRNHRWAAKYVERYLIKHEGGELYSYTMRRLFKDDFGIDAGYGSYGWWMNGLRPHVKIGSYCSIAKNVKRFSHNKKMDMFSTHSMFQREYYGYFDEVKEEHKITIGNDVWIGADVIITPGCSKIGDGAVVGAGSLVACDIEPYAVVAGNPARLIRYRFNEEQRKKLMDSKWYLLAPDELVPIKEYSEDIDTFAEKAAEIVKEKLPDCI